MKVQLRTSIGKRGQTELTSIILSALVGEALGSSRMASLGLALTRRRRRRHLQRGTWAAAWRWVAHRISSTLLIQTSTLGRSASSTSMRASQCSLVSSLQMKISKSSRTSRVSHQTKIASQKLRPIR